MEETKKIKIDAHRLYGEFKGTLEGVLAWDLHPYLEKKLKAKLEELEQTEIILKSDSMKFTNPNGGEVIQLEAEGIKQIIEKILFVSSNGGSWVCFPNALESCNEGFYIVSDKWMNQSPESKQAFKNLKLRIHSLEERLKKINDLSK